MLHEGEYDVLTRYDCIQAMDGHHINVWNGLTITRVQIAAGMPTRFTQERTTITTRLTCNDPAYFKRLTVIMYGGTLVPDSYVLRMTQVEFTYMLGTSVDQGGSGYVDGDPALLRGAPEYTNVGAAIDEPPHDAQPNCVFKELTDEQHKVLMEKIEGLAEWDGFNHTHYYVVVTNKPLELGEVLSVSYFWRDRRTTTYSYAGKPREKPVDVAAMVKGKEAKKDQRARQIAGLNPSKGTKRRAADITDSVPSSEVNIPVSSKTVNKEPSPVKLTLQEVEELNIDRLKKYYHDERPKKLTLDWCDNAAVMLSYEYQGDNTTPFTLQGSTCRKVLKAERSYA